MTRFLLPLILLACTDGAEGTSIGNPTKTLMRVAPAGQDLNLTEAQITIVSIDVQNGNRFRTLDGSDSTDLLAGIPLDLPDGDWTSIQASVEGPLSIRGTDDGADLDLQLEMERIVINASREPLEIGQPHVFQLAFEGWLQAENAGWTAGESHLVRPGDATHDVLVDLIQNRSQFLLDADGDGFPD